MYHCFRKCSRCWKKFPQVLIGFPKRRFWPFISQGLTPPSDLVNQGATVLWGFVGRLSRHRDYRHENWSNESICHVRWGAEHEALERTIPSRNTTKFATVHAHESWRFELKHPKLRVCSAKSKLRLMRPQMLYYERDGQIDACCDLCVSNRGMRVANVYLFHELWVGNRSMRVANECTCCVYRYMPRTEINRHRERRRCGWRKIRGFCIENCQDFVKLMR